MLTNNDAITQRHELGCKSAITYKQLSLQPPTKNITSSRMMSLHVQIVYSTRWVRKNKMQIEQFSAYKEVH